MEVLSMDTEIFNDILDEEDDYQNQEKEEGFKDHDCSWAIWAINKIKENEIFYTKEAEYHKQELEKAKARFERKNSYLIFKLEEYFWTVPARETKTQLKFDLPNGTLKLNKRKTEFKISDENALLSWLESHDPNLIKVQKKPDWASIKKNLDISNNLVITKEGEIVEGIVIENKPEEFKVITKNNMNGE